MAGRTDNPAAKFRKAYKLFESGRYLMARTILAELQKALPREPDVLRLLGACCSEMGAHDEAVEYFLRVVERAPAPRDFFNLGKALQQAGHFEKALHAHEAGLAMAPSDAILQHGRATTLAQLKRREEAIAGYRAVLRSQPDFAEAYFNLGEVFLASAKPHDALKAFRSAQKQGLAREHVITGIVRSSLLSCEWQSLEDDLAFLAQCIQGRHRIDPYVVLAVDDEPNVHKLAAKTWTACQMPGDRTLKLAREAMAAARLKIAYVSADFREHAVSRLITGLFEAHDRSQFEIVAVSIGTDDCSDLRRRIEGAVDEFIDLQGKSVSERVSAIRKTGAAIAIDLMGFTIDNDYRIFERRIAPVQVSFLGYPATTALSTMDYVVVDAVVGSRAALEGFTEAPVVLDVCCQPNDPKRARPQEARPRASYGLPDDGFVFCAFNNTGKILPSVFGVWMRILAAVPDSVLWLPAQSADTRTNLRDQAVRSGIEPRRLVFTEWAASHEEHLARYLQAGLFLDTFPYGAHTTASDALWMGCPVLTLQGQSYPSRLASSLLSSIGLPELATTSLAEYETKAIAIASAPSEMNRIRNQLVTVRDTAGLFDASLFANRIELAYLEMWRRFKQGSKPRMIDLKGLARPS